jgi:asparagine synthase (glutamine-hydrolysing)
MGEKPLYFGWANGTFLFASETKSLCRHPHFAPTINRHALTLLLRHNYITAPYSIYRGIYKLKPGTLLTVVGAEQCHCPWEPDDPPFESYRGNGVFFRPYWSLDDAVANGQAQPFDGTEHDAVEALERVLSDAIVSQQISDVPLGAFLSGGVDSSTIVALMQAHSSRPVKTFTIGFREPGYNEAEFAKEVARHLGTNHTELYVTPEDARNVIPLLPTMYDEPFADSSQIPTFLVSRMAKQHVTVALSGDAGDELFGGYSRYFQTRAIATKLSRLPLPARKLVANCLKSVPVGVWNSVLGPLEQCTPRAFRGGIPGDRIHKGADILATEHMEQLYREFISQWKSPAEVVIDSREPLTALTRDLSFPGIREFEHRMMYLDSVTYLPDDILVKVDRAAMAVSLETRVPFLDHRVVEFAWRLPLAFKMRGDIGKWLLRQVLYKYVPSSLIERPKTGFAVPIDIWLRGPLREWGESLLDEKRMNQDGIFNSAEIRRKWNEHVSGTRNWHYYLWDILMFQAWKESTTQGGGI